MTINIKKYHYNVYYKDGSTVGSKTFDDYRKWTFREYKRANPDIQIFSLDYLGMSKESREINEEQFNAICGGFEE